MTRTGTALILEAKRSLAMRKNAVIDDEDDDHNDEAGDDKNMMTKRKTIGWLTVTIL